MQTKNLESGRVLAFSDYPQGSIPPGQWQLLGIGSEIKEEVCSEVIPELNCRERYPNYCGDYPIWFHSRKESLHSIIRSLGYEPDKAIVLFEPKNMIV